MSYLVLARKYRPKTFESLVGQEHVVRALKHALDTQRLHHAYLFTGTRGIGKTTLSRLLAKSLNCEEGITASPCGVCEACQAIDADRFVDYIEMDAASNRGIADMLQLLEQAIYAPTSARFKIYMIDEVHMLTAQAFNAMLKTLEEPPTYVKFILATTDPQKIPVTVLSRCLQFNLKQMPVPDIVSYLDVVLSQEKIAFEKPALRLLAEGASGSMRDALSLTDQAISYTAGQISLAAVQEMLGALDQTYLLRILAALAAQDGAGMMAVADEMATRSLSYGSALRDLAILLNRIALFRTAPSAVQEDIPEYEAIRQFAGVFDAPELQLFYQIVVHGRNELGLAPDEYAGFTMTLLRLLAFRSERAEPVQLSLGTPPANETVSPAEEVQTAPQAQTRPEAGTVSQPEPLPASAAQPEKAEVVSMDAVPPWIDLDEAPAVTVAPVVKPSPGASTPAPLMAELILDDEKDDDETLSTLAEPLATAVESFKLSDWDEDWPTLADALPLRGMVQQLAQQTELVNWKQTETGAYFHLRSPMETLCSPANIEKLSQAITNWFELPVSITTETGPVGLTASQNALKRKAERQQEAEQAITNDPYIQNLIREFDATIVPGSIKPI